MSAPERLDPARTALLFFDMLNGHVKKNDPATKARYAPVIARAVRLLEATRRAGVVVTYAAAPSSRSCTCWLDSRRA
jgi:isochorismate hydrolase